MSSLILLLVCSWVSPWVAAAPEPAAKNIEGEWEIVTAEMGGQAMPLTAFQGGKLRLNAGKYSFLNDVGEYKTFFVDGRNAMDVVGTKGPNKGKTIPAIFETGENRLTICYDLSCQDRPKAFKSEKGSRHFLVTYRRSSD